MQRKCIRTGFTLVELLVVIAIIAIIAALLLPSLVRSKESTRSVVCVNNMQQLGIACMVYSADTGRFPSFLEWIYPDKATGNDTVDLTKGSLYPYLKSKDVYRCPSETGVYDAISGPIDHSYVMQCMMCHAHDSSACLAPSRTVYFLEMAHLSRGYFTGMSTVPLPANNLAFRHNQREHFLFVDTHAERLTREQYAGAVSEKRFWYPTETTGTQGNP